ncbi:hypothetical protein BH10BDE1_BH10BDE1_33020 [soil metagenome]
MKYLALIFLVLISTSHALAADKSQIASSSEPSETYKPEKIYLGIGMSALVGFGTGQAVQDRYLERGIWYTGAELAGFVLLIGSYGDCRLGDGDCKDSQGRRASVGALLLGVAHIAEIVDAVIWSTEYYDQHHPTAFIQPERDGASLQFALSF